MPIPVSRVLPKSNGTKIFHNCQSPCFASGVSCNLIFLMYAYVYLFKIFFHFIKDEIADNIKILRPASAANSNRRRESMLFEVAPASTKTLCTGFPFSKEKIQRHGLQEKCFCHIHINPFRADIHKPELSQFHLHELSNSGCSPLQISLYVSGRGFFSKLQSENMNSNSGITFLTCWLLL